MSEPIYAVAVVAVVLELNVTAVSATPFERDWLTVIFGLEMLLM